MSLIESFEVNIARLKRRRKVWVYLPDDYKSDGKPVPVIYMQDGQNLFYDELTPYNKAWHADKVLDKIFKATGRSAAVVGVECLPEKRLSEYSPWKASPDFLRRSAGYATDIGGEGTAYAEFFARDLVKEVESRYNFACTRDGRAVVGSSMGGLISCYIALLYQDVFETSGLFSTFTPFNSRAVGLFLKNTVQVYTQYAYIYCGGKEGLDVPDALMVRASEKLYESFATRGIVTELVIDSHMEHSEVAWEKYFYGFAFGFIARYYDCKN